MKAKKVFLRTAAISAAIWTSLAILICGTAESYKQMRKIGFDEDKNAVEYNNGVLRVFDFYF